MTADRLRELQREYTPDMDADALHDWAQDLLTVLMERPAPDPAERALSRGLNEDATMLLLLGHVERDVCLKAHSSYDPWTLSRQLGVDALTVEVTQHRAATQQLTTTETAWTGSWRRVILTPAGKKHLKALRESFGHLLHGRAAPAQASLFTATS